MLQMQRRDDILRLLEKNSELTVKEMSAMLYASPATIRRDLCALEKKGLLKRSFGGAVRTRSYSDQLPLIIRSAENIEQKKRICKKAAEHIKDGDTIFLDASSTTYFLVPHLSEISDLTIITNNPYLCTVLAEMKIRNFCTGGKMLNDSLALVGHDAEQMIRGIRAHKCFFSARGCSEVITDSSKDERDVKLAMLSQSKEHIFLCDTSKKGLEFPYIITSTEKVDAIIDEI